MLVFLLRLNIEFFIILYGSFSWLNIIVCFVVWFMERSWELYKIYIVEIYVVIDVYDLKRSNWLVNFKLRLNFLYDFILNCVKNKFKRV